MSEHRVYGEKIEIDPEHTHALYNQRAQKIDQMDNPYVSVLLGDQNPEYAIAWDQFEKQIILPKMNVSDNSTVLDIGCGIGRWAEVLIPISKYYCGMDMSEEMIKQAQKRNQYLGREYDFVNDSFEHFCQLPEDAMKCKFDRLWMCGVMMYINDAHLESGLKGLLSKMDEHAVVYFTETIALDERLTLREFFSTALDADYDVIYRTEQEYNQLYLSWFDAGFKIKEQGLQPHFNKEEQFRETDRWYTILER